MAGICTASTPKAGGSCQHRDTVIALDGQSFTFANEELPDEPLTLPELRELARLGARRLRLAGVSLADFLNRVTNGDEATNVKQYLLLGKDVTKANIGTAYVNVPPGANGERSLVEFTGCTEFRIVLSAVLPGSGPHNIRVVRDSDDAVLYESPSIPANGNERELDTDWLALPAAASGLGVVRLQAKSSTAADDPIFRRCVLLVR